MKYKVGDEEYYYSWSTDRKNPEFPGGLLQPDGKLLLRFSDGNHYRFDPENVIEVTEEEFIAGTVIGL